jgi:hypothetical protein
MYVAYMDKAGPVSVMFKSVLGRAVAPADLEPEFA